MILLTTRDFHYVSVDFYVDAEDSCDFWITQEQIGKMLNYRNPERSIRLLHERFEWHLNHLYREVELNIRRKGICKVVAYNFDGLLELCSFSRKSRATETVNFLWQVKREFEQGLNFPTVKSELQLFNYGDNHIRAINQDGEFWFVAKDICDVLEIKNSRDAVNELYDNEKNTVAITDGNRGNPNTTVINEPGLYKLIFKSRKTEAKKFQDWIFYEVLPSLRKTGSYSIRARKMLTTRATDTKFYSATEIAHELGMTDMDVVRLATEHNFLMYGFTRNCEWYFTEEGRGKILDAARI